MVQLVKKQALSKLTISIGRVTITLHADKMRDSVNSRDLIKELKQAGWVLDRVKGSHHQFKHPEHKLPVTVPHPKKTWARD
jgi:predicted RNA binding protein YcfA (HicA-like mRNA interferase family)